MVYAIVLAPFASVRVIPTTQRQPLHPLLHICYIVPAIMDAADIQDTRLRYVLPNLPILILLLF